MKRYYVFSILILCVMTGALYTCTSTRHPRSTPKGEADRVKSTCGADCECICLEFPRTHAGRRCACRDH